MKRPSTGQHRARKRFGQNFLRDDAIIDAIVRAIGPGKSEHLVEIGPGHGALTGALVDSSGQLDVIELDRDLIPSLLAAYSVKPGFKLHNADALKFDFASLANEEGPPLRIVGNLPYNISTPIIFKLLEIAPLVQDMHFMLQREVVQRLAATPGHKEWGRLGIMAQFHCSVEALFEVPPEAFTPQPKVHSAIVRLTPHRDPKPYQCNEQNLSSVVRAAFAQRRKTLRNNMKGLIDSAALAELGIDPGVRAETLTLAQFIEITNATHD